MKKAASFALGCKVNQYESEAIAELFAEKGYEIVGIDEEADVYVINTCTVTNFGDKKSRHLVIGTKDRAQIVEMVEQYDRANGVENHVSDIMKERVFEPLSIQKLANRTRAYLKIQDGCSQYCSYCIIPYARGPVRSLPLAEAVAQARQLQAEGYRELVFTGIEISSWGRDLHDGSSLIDLVEAVAAAAPRLRLRLGSLEPRTVTEDFCRRASQLPNLCPHFHLSLQSGCDKTLKEMNRKYDTEKYRQAVATLRKYLPKVALTTDIIVGFPGETEEDFRESYAFAEEIGFAKIHVFPYSPKRGTPAAARKDQLLNAVKSERSHTLIQLSDRMAADFLADAVGTDAEVLYERAVGDGIYEGHTTNYMKVHGRSEADLTNRIAKTHITRAEGEMLFGDVEV